MRQKPFFELGSTYFSICCIRTFVSARTIRTTALLDLVFFTSSSFTSPVTATHIESCKLERNFFTDSRALKRYPTQQGPFLLQDLQSIIKVTDQAISTRPENNFQQKSKGSHNKNTALPSQQHKTKSRSSTSYKPLKEKDMDGISESLAQQGKNNEHLEGPTSIHAAYIEEVHNVPMKILIRPFPSILDEAKVLSLMKTIEDPGKSDQVPPIDILWVTGSQGGDYYYSFGGCHRYEAFKRLQRESIPCKIVKSTVDDIKTYLGGSMPELL